MKNNLKKFPTFSLILLYLFTLSLNTYPCLLLLILVLTLSLSLGDAEIRRRSINPDAGPRGGNTPVITTDGNYLLDIQFLDGLKLFGKIESYDKIVAEIETVEGVLEHGLVVGVATKAVVGVVVEDQGQGEEDGDSEGSEIEGSSISSSGPRVVQL